MKKILLLLFVSILAVSCVDDSNKLPQDFPDTGWIQLNSAAAETSAASGSFGVPVALGVGNNAKGQVITYNVALVSPTGPAGLSLGDFNFNLAPGVKSGMLNIPLVNDGSNYELEITLVKTSNLDYTIGLSDNSKKTVHRVKVCGLIINDWVGTFAVREAFSDGVNSGLSLGAFFGEMYEITTTLDPADTTSSRILMTNSGANTFITPDPMGVTFDACSQSITLDSTPNIAFFRDLEVENASFNPATSTMTIVGQLGTFGEYTIELRKI